MQTRNRFHLCTKNVGVDIPKKHLSLLIVILAWGNIQACVFSVDYKVEALSDREFGSVFLGKENVAVSVVSAGWAKV